MPLEKPIKPEQGWEEQKAPILQQWDSPGTGIEGRLISCQPVSISVDGVSKRVLEYIVRFKTGDMVKFLESYDLKQKLRPEHAGCDVRVKYLGQDENVKGGPSNTPMKVFSVFVKPRPAGGEGPTGEQSPFD